MFSGHRHENLSNLFAGNLADIWLILTAALRRTFFKIHWTCPAWLANFVQPRHPSFKNNRNWCTRWIQGSDVIYEGHLWSDVIKIWVQGWVCWPINLVAILSMYSIRSFDPTCSLFLLTWCERPSGHSKDSPGENSFIFSQLNWGK